LKQWYLFIALAACTLNGCSGKEELSKSNTSETAVKPEPPPPQPVETDLPLDAKAAKVACGKMLKLDNKAVFVKLDLVNRLARLLDDGGFTDEELKELNADKGLQDQEFKAYGFGYITWEKSKDVSRADFDKMVISATHSADETSLSSTEKAQLDAFFAKYKRLMSRAFDLGRHDAKISPCPY